MTAKLLHQQCRLIVEALAQPAVVHGDGDQQGRCFKLMAGNVREHQPGQGACQLSLAGELELQDDIAGDAFVEQRRGEARQAGRQGGGNGAGFIPPGEGGVAGGAEGRGAVG